MCDHRARDDDADALPDDIAALQAALICRATRARQVEAELAVAKAKASDDQALIAHQQLQIAKLKRELYGQRSERSARLLDQLELQLEELESSATEDELAAERRRGQDHHGARPSPASARRASPSPRICRASASSCRRRPPARAAAAPGCASWARTSPRRWR